MLFNSFDFIFLFLPICFGLYFLLNKLKLYTFGVAFLSLVSLFFYGYWNFIYVPLILFSITLNFLIGKRISKIDSGKRNFLLLGIIFNVILLGYYKYTDFFIENFNGIFASDIPLQHIVLPLGISFFTFTQIAFLTDCFSGKVKEQSFLSYSLFVTYFPHLLAGPIIHHKEMMPQFSDKNLKQINYQNISIGLFLFFIGLFKKVFVADFFAKYANFGFNANFELSMIDAWITSLSYTFQLYFDFSGYTDMAIGISYMFNIKLPINFNSPYKARNIQDFWHRWHMTLSRFLSDYIYIPLGGNKKGNKVTYVNVFIVFLVGGIWHGAGWGFVLWGVIHGIAQIIVRIYASMFKPMNKFLAWFLTFNFINITWVFFRANDISTAMKILNSMFNYQNIELSEKLLKLSNENIVGIYRAIDFGYYAMLPISLLLCGSLLVCICCKNSNEIVQNANFGYKNILAIVFMAFCSFCASITALDSPFLYFNF